MYAFSWLSSCSLVSIGRARAPLPCPQPQPQPPKLSSPTYYTPTSTTNSAKTHSSTFLSLSPKDLYSFQHYLFFKPTLGALVCPPRSRLWPQSDILPLSRVLVARPHVVLLWASLSGLWAGLVLRLLPWPGPLWVGLTVPGCYSYPGAALSSSGRKGVGGLRSKKAIQWDVVTQSAEKRKPVRCLCEGFKPAVGIIRILYQKQAFASKHGIKEFWLNF